MKKLKIITAGYKTRQHHFFYSFELKGKPGRHEISFKSRGDYMLWYIKWEDDLRGMIKEYPKEYLEKMFGKVNKKDPVIISYVIEDDINKTEHLLTSLSLEIFRKKVEDFQVYHDFGTIKQLKGFSKEELTAYKRRQKNVRK